MPRTCIICGNRAGSAEHIFPAGLGGRRTNRGIYCGPHNNGFSGLAAAIVQQLKPINALLAVRQDHSKTAEPVAYTSPEGEALVIFDGAVTAKVDRPPSGDVHHIGLMFGGPNGLQAIAYIALTFFAHYFPEHARKAGAQPIKDFVTTPVSNEFVWWESHTILDTLPPNKYPFGHTIALTTSAAGDAVAFISLFGSLNFGVALGSIDDMTDHSVIVFIDPQADHPPDDINVTREMSVRVSLKKPTPLHAHLEKTIRDGIGQKALTRLLQNIEEWKFGKDMAPLLSRLNAVGKPPSQHRRAVELIVEETAGRIYRLMYILVSEFAAKHGGDPTANQTISILKALVVVTGDDNPTLSAKGQATLIAAATAFVDDLVDRLAVGDIDMDYLWSLFSGGHGGSIVWQIMCDIAQSA